jgi:stage III sporulation protein SpoIIIAA
MRYEDINKLISILPRKIKSRVTDPENLIEIVLDLGRPLELRYHKHSTYFTDHLVSKIEIDEITKKITDFGEDCRAGINGTLHRVSKILNRTGNTIGLTCRVGRAFYGAEKLIQDYLEDGKSILLVGKAGSGKTSLLRSCANFISEHGRRVVIVDTSDEIAGAGDIPHPAVGRARKLSVPTGWTQYEMLLQAVENHWPEVLVIDEISDEKEVQAVRSIAKRGVQLLATAHGQKLEDLIQNPPLVNLVGGVKTVTLSDESASKRGTNKSVQERQFTPTFDVIVELTDFDIIKIYDDVSTAIDCFLRGDRYNPEERRLIEKNKVIKVREKSITRLQRNEPEIKNGHINTIKTSKSKTHNRVQR